MFLCWFSVQKTITLFSEWQSRYVFCCHNRTSGQPGAAHDTAGAMNVKVPIAGCTCDKGDKNNKGRFHSKHQNIFDSYLGRQWGPRELPDLAKLSTKWPTFCFWKQKKSMRDSLQRGITDNWFANSVRWTLLLNTFQLLQPAQWLHFSLTGNRKLRHLWKRFASAGYILPLKKAACRERWETVSWLDVSLESHLSS